jgi:galactose mutarotase-like enzyme
MECHGWPYFGIWSKKGCSEFVCLEPWYGAADRIDASGVLAEKDGILKLAPGKDFSAGFDIKFT